MKIRDRIRKYVAPTWLARQDKRGGYETWLQRRAIAHVRRDRKRGHSAATVAEYKAAIHAAVVRSQGRDAYTGERLRWGLISTYDNDQSKTHRRAYKHGFALLPTVDHVGDGTGPADFVICAWRTNDAKADLSRQEFLALCRRVVGFHDRRAGRKPQPRALGAST